MMSALLRSTFVQQLTRSSAAAAAAATVQRLPPALAPVRGHLLPYSKNNTSRYMTSSVVSDFSVGKPVEEHGRCDACFQRQRSCTLTGIRCCQWLQEAAFHSQDSKKQQTKDSCLGLSGVHEEEGKHFCLFL